MTSRSLPPTPWWLPLAGLLLTVAGMVVGSVALALAARGLHAVVQDHPAWRHGPVGAILDVWVMLGSVALALPMLALVQHHLHGQGLGALISPFPTPRWALAGRSALLWGGLVLASLGADAVLSAWQGDGWPQASDQIPALLLFILATLPPLLLQVTAEEALFRGYLTRALERWHLSPALAALVVALVFTSLHTQAWGQAVWDQRLLYVCLSLQLSWISRRTGGLEAAIGIHFAQNALAFYVDGALGDDYPSLLGIGGPGDQPASLADIGQVAVSMAVLCGAYAMVAVRTRWLGNRF